MVQLVYVTHGQTHLSTNIPKASTTSGIGLDKLRKNSTIHSFTAFTLHSQYKTKWQANEQHAENMNLKQNLQIICKISRLFYDFYYDLQILAVQGLAGLHYTDVKYKLSTSLSPICITLYKLSITKFYHDEFLEIANVKKLMFNALRE